MDRYGGKYGKGQREGGREEGGEQRLTDSTPKKDQFKLKQEDWGIVTKERKVEENKNIFQDR